ncbi:CAAX amino terminal protease family protein [Actinidia rufa]|uniref:CAAX amino terminal protease family protein n=1 Tax=Actinidia rufa TaxID=165716 RepID=A0A7J0G4G7_9ERIC|nr:CAAX amino terminal protease family protein [Actinidia rufa]
MIGVHWLPLCAWPPTSKLSANSDMSLSVSLGNEASLSSHLLNPKLCPRFYVKCCCINKEQPTPKASEDFSVLESDIPWDRRSVWSTLALYIFSLHIPLSFGGLSVVASVLHQPILDPQTEALSLLAIQTLELIAALWLLRFVAMPKVKIFSFFTATNPSKERNWLLASVLGFGFLILVVFFTSVLADQVIGPKDANNPILKEILSSGSVAKTACVLVYCLVTPLLEESLYRGFLLRSLASEMKWQQAVIVSSAVFSAAHFSGENFLQLFVVGSVLGCSYCWTGNLSSSFLIHSLYNALILIITLLS